MLARLRRQGVARRGRGTQSMRDPDGPEWIYGDRPFPSRASGRRWEPLKLGVSFGGEVRPGASQPVVFLLG